MRRRTVLLGALGLALAGCDRARPGAPRPPEPVTLPSSATARVAGLAYVGGFVPQGWPELNPPALVVYADGTAVAGASRVLALDLAAVAGEVDQLRTDLAGLPPTVQPDKNNLVDAPDTRIEVLGADGTLRSVRAYALGELSGYPPSLLDAAGRLKGLAERVTAQGRPYTADRIRLVTVPAGQQTVPSGQWPDAVPVPPAQSNPVRVLEMRGEQARAAIAAIPARENSATGWQVLATPRDGTLAVAWRYLLPDE
ncbi:MAG TPA: hypothetical protein VFC00_13710 [Micromonosporaceae bacterium]|nr:hypothetical protein [Micromonosporaceae bacterium]